MKSLFAILSLLIVLLSACKTNKTVNISGTITNAESKTLILINNLNDTKDTVEIVDGTFSIETSIVEEQYVYLQSGRSLINLYVYPGNVITISFDETELKKRVFTNIQIEGSEASAILNRLQILNTSQDLRKQVSFIPTEFDAAINENYSANMAIIDSFANATKNTKLFAEKLKLITNIEKAGKYNIYSMYHKRFAPNDTSEIPEEFATIGDDIPLDNYAYFKELMPYSSFVKTRIKSSIDKQIKDSGLNNPYTKAYMEKKFDAIKAYNTFSEIKDALGNEMLSTYARTPDSIKTIIETRYKEIVSSEKTISAFEAKITQAEKLKEGNTAPGFSYPDIDGNMVSSADLKGKVIYIDVWATWCGPCKREIPFLKELEKELHKKDIAFVSISVDDDKEAWEKMVKADELKGYQLHAKKAWKSDIIKNYLISGIPRFILIDKAGKIVTANASRPSNPETKETLLKYADM